MGGWGVRGLGCWGSKKEQAEGLAPYDREIWRLVCSCVRLNIHVFSSLLTNREDYDAVNEGEESVVFAHTHIQTRVVLSATLTFDNVAGTAF